MDTIITRSSRRHVRARVLDADCVVEAVIIENVDLVKGESLTTTSIVTIIDPTGQTIHPKTIPIDDFRALVRKLED